MIIPSFHGIGLITNVKGIDIGITNIPPLDSASASSNGENIIENDLNKISGFLQYRDKNQDVTPIIRDYTELPYSFFSNPDTEPGNVIPNQYIVVLKNNDIDISEIFSQISSKVNLNEIKIIYEYQKVLNGFVIHVTNERIIDEIKKIPIVDYVERDVVVEGFAQAMPTGINRIDADQSYTKSGDGTGSVNVDIAILDTGIDLDHPDLNVYHQKSFVSSSADDDNGHGTHVAGIAAAKDNNIGTVGVAPGAKLWAIKVLDSKGTGPLSTVIKGIDYVTQNANQIEVVNLSLGCECKSTAFDTAVNNAVKAGIVFTVAAGNGAKDAHNFSPANNPNVIAVSAIGDSDGKCGSKGPSTGYGSDDTLSSFSNYGSIVDIAAPGAKIYSTYKGNTYATISGTSMASPHVAGAAALFMAKSPDASPSTVYNELINKGTTASTTCDGNGHGYFTGDKDQFREPLLYVRNIGVTDSPVVVQQPPKADAGPDQTVNSGSTVRLDGSRSSDPNNSPLTYSWTQASGPSVTLSDSSSQSPTFRAPETSTTTNLVFELEVTNNNNIKSERDNVRITVQPTNNNPSNGNSICNLLGDGSSLRNFFGCR
ncbi:S8 family peptidase [Candidatus Nitrosocosmicus franklandus]|uniref:S8 family peptidase n=1 Tax=Candidatus Nitrosocosmicus franklandianus TaxID=1798806 RepID=UPI0015592FBC|nr:S8 family peptidase [Candidatus Nitrosocosmicus franklandus]